MDEMNNEVVITCAVTGGGDTAGKSEHVPVTPKQIAEAAIQAAKEGAAIVHCHVRDPETGQNAFKTELFAEVVARIRESETDVVINLTGGNGGAIIIDDDKPGEWQEGSDLTIPEGRVAHALDLLPEGGRAGWLLPVCGRRAEWSSGVWGCRALPCPARHANPARSRSDKESEDVCMQPTSWCNG